MLAIFFYHLKGGIVINWGLSTGPYLYVFFEGLHISLQKNLETISNWGWAGSAGECDSQA